MASRGQAGVVLDHAQEASWTQGTGMFVAAGVYVDKGSVRSRGLDASRGQAQMRTEPP
jgi:hypothetical protein